MRLGYAFGIFALLIASAGTAMAQPKCEPDKAASKYPALAGKTVKIGQDG